MPISPATVQDYFYRGVTNSWGTSNTGQQWYLSSTSAAISSNTRFAINENSTAGTVKVTSGETTTYHDAAYLNGGVSGTYQEVLMKFSVGSTSANFGAMIRRTSNNSFYAARMDSGTSISIIVKNGNLASPYLAQVATASFSYTANTVYWMRFRTDTDDRLKLRVWAANAAEPTTWNINTAAYTGSLVPTTGPCGVWWRGNGVNATHTVYQFYAFDSVNYGSEPALPVTDNFGTSSAIGFGRASVTGHQWRGSLAEDPDSYGWSTNLDSYISSGDNFGTAVLTPASTPVYSFIGPNVGDAHLTAKINFSNTQQNAGLLLRATPIYTASTPSTTAYMIRIGSSDTLLRMYKIVSGTQTQIGSYSIGAMTTPVKYQMRMQVEGTTIRAKAWIDGTSEPNWQLVVTDSSVTGTGSGGLYLINGTTAARTYQFSELSMTTPLLNTWTGDAALDATGNLTSDSTRTRLVSTTGISGAGNLAAAAQKVISGQFGGSGTADVAVSAFVQKSPQLASAAFSGTGFLVSASSSKIASGVVTISADSAITVATRKEVIASTAPSAVGSLAAAFSAIRQTILSFDGQGILTADSIKQKGIGIDPFTATSSLVVGSSVTYRNILALSAAGDMRADANDFRVDLIANGTLLAGARATINGYVELSGDTEILVGSSKATTQIAQAMLSGQGNMVSSSRASYVFASLLSGNTDMMTATSRTVSGVTAFSADSDVAITLVDLVTQYDENMRYRMQFYHKRARSLYPSSTSVRVKQLPIGLPTSGMYYAILKNDVVLEFGITYITWGGVVSDHSYVTLVLLPTSDNYAFIVQSAFPSVMLQGAG